MNIPFSLFFLAFAIQRAAAESSILEQHEVDVFQESRSLAHCAYVHSGSGGNFCDVQLNQGQCATAAQSNCVHGATGNTVNSKYIWDDNDIDALKLLVDEENDQGNKTPNLDFLQLPPGCYILKGKQGGTLYYYYKASGGSATQLTTGDKNICFGATPSPTAAVMRTVDFGFTIVGFSSQWLVFLHNGWLSFTNVGYFLTNVGYFLTNVGFGNSISHRIVILGMFVRKIIAYNILN